MACLDTTVVSDLSCFVARSRLAGVDPETTVRKKVDETIFRHILAANADLLESSRDYEGIVLAAAFRSNHDPFPPPNDQPAYGNQRKGRRHLPQFQARQIHHRTAWGTNGIRTRRSAGPSRSSARSIT
ncbi:MAG: hypothetical protein ACLSAH_20360 [Bilophila wadsworthia]